MEVQRRYIAFFCWDADIQTDNQMDTKINRQTDKQTIRWTHRQTDKRTDIPLSKIVRRSNKLTDGHKVLNMYISIQKMMPRVKKQIKTTIPNATLVTYSKTSPVSPSVDAMDFPIKSAMAATVG